MRKGLARLRGEGRLHLLVLVLVIISEAIYTRRISLGGVGVILLLPLLYAFVLAAIINPNVTRRFAGLVDDHVVRCASPYIVIAILPFIAKFGTLVGPSIETIIEAGPALVLQEIGNLGTIALGFPIAMVLGMRREAIGATFSIAREPNLAIIAERYGLNGPEGTGVMGVYITGTLFGTVVFSVIASLLASLGTFHPYALAMACGVGSGSMMAACSGTLAALFPTMEDEIVAFAGTSNLLTNVDGLYMGLFVALPLVEALYRRWRRTETVTNPVVGGSVDG